MCQMGRPLEGRDTHRSDHQTHPIRLVSLERLLLGKARPIPESDTAQGVRGDDSVIAVRSVNEALPEVGRKLTATRRLPIQ